MLKTRANIVTTVNPKVNEFLTLLQDPEVYDVFKSMIVQTLSDPEGCQLIQRVSNIEKHLGADDDYCIGKDIFNDDKEVLMTIPEQFSLISSRIEEVSIPVLHETVFSGNETDVRARFLKEYVSEYDMRNGKRFVTSQEVQAFLLGEDTKKGLPEEHRTTAKAARKVASDVMKRASDMFSECLILTKNKKGLNVIEYTEKR